MSKYFRAFIAIDLPKNIEKSIACAIKPLKQDPSFGRFKWVIPKNWHITVCFLGNITDQQYQCLDQKLKTSAKSIAPFYIKLASFIPFPSTKQFHMLVLKPEPEKGLKNLAKFIEDIVALCGVKIEKRQFKPHLTCGYVSKKHHSGSSCNYHSPSFCHSRESVNPKKFTQEYSKYIFDNIKFSSIKFKATCIKLFKSQPQQTASLYTAVAVYSFFDIHNQSFDLTIKIPRLRKRA